MQHNVRFVVTSSHKNFLKIKITEKLETIVILHVSAEVKHVVFVT